MINQCEEYRERAIYNISLLFARREREREREISITARELWPSQDCVFIRALLIVKSHIIQRRVRECKRVVIAVSRTRN